MLSENSATDSLGETRPVREAPAEDWRQFGTATNNAAPAPRKPIAVTATAQTPADAKPTPALKPVSKSRKHGSDVIDDIVKLLRESPGLRSEEIQRRLKTPPELVKSALMVLRKDKRVRTEGSNRATRYFIVPAAPARS
jgi:hypothetical protein